MLERILVLAALTGVVAGISLVVRMVTKRKVAQTVHRGLPQALQDRLEPGVLTILFFHGPHCPSCVQQSRVLDRIERETTCTVVRLDAVREVEASRSLGIMTVPATVVVSPDRTLRSVNLGYRGEDALRGQL